MTEAVEAPIYLFAGRRLPLPQRWGLALGTSALTHPLLWWLFPENADLYVPAVVIGETLVILAEGLLAKLAGLSHPWFWSAAANVSSVLLGFLWMVLAAG